MRLKKKNYKTEVRKMKTQYWYYKGSDIIGSGEEESKMREERANKRRLRAEEVRRKERCA
jgi:hypothetical protein